MTKSDNIRWSRYNYDWEVDAENSFVYNSINNLLMCIKTVKIKDYKKGIFDECDDQLLAEGFIASDDEVNKAKYVLTKRKFGNKSLSLWIYTTMDCNFDCYYCYQNREAVYMSDEVADKTYKFCEKLINELKPEELEVIFIGGEPLLNVPIIEKMTELFKDQQQIKFSIITNGSLLNKENVELLLSHNVTHFQITLDGPPEIHNQRRIYRNGAGSFDTILENLLYLLNNYEEKIDVNLRINIDEENINYLKNLLKILKENKLNGRLILTIGDTIGQNSKPILYQQIIEFYKYAVSEGFAIMITETSVCWMGSERLFLFAADGKIYKCTSLVGQEKYSVGNVNNDTNHILDNNFYAIGNMRPWKECLGCEFLGICSGGCRYRRLVATGLWDEIKYCRKEYIAEILKITYSSKFSL